MATKVKLINYSDLTNWNCDSLPLRMILRSFLLNEMFHDDKHVVQKHRMIFSTFIMETAPIIEEFQITHVPHAIIATERYKI